MKPRWLIAILLAGLAICSVLVVRHHRRISTSSVLQPAELKPLTEWQQGIQLDPAREYRRDQQLRKKLRREEIRQKPQEGRN